MSGGRSRGSAARPGAAAARTARTPDLPGVADAPLPRKAAIAVAAALVLAWAAVFAPLLAGRAFVLGDSAAYRPYAEFSRSRWAQQHDRTLWNPYVFLGIPSAASLADPRPQWLPGPLLTLTDAAAPVTDRWRVPLAVLAGALAMAALARSLWRCGPEAAALAGAAWLLAPSTLVPLAFGHDAEVWTLALWPAVALAARATLASATPSRAAPRALALAAALALQALGAHPQFMAYGLVAAALLALPLVRGATAPARAASGAAVVLAAAMSAAVWLPAWRYAAESVRESVALMLRESPAFSAGARDLLSAVWPHAAGFGDATYWGGMRATDYPHFLGAALVALSLGGTLAARARSRPTALALFALAAFAMLAACGPRTPLGNLLAALPVTRAFRTPVTWMALAQFCAALLAARGLHAAGAARGRAVPALGAALALAGLALLASGAGAAGYADAMSAARAATAGADWPARAAAEGPVAMRDLGLRLLLAGTALALAFGNAWLPARLRPPVLALAAIVAALDLAAVAVPVAWHATGPATALAAPVPTPAARIVAADTRFRSMALEPAAYYSNDWIAWRARSVAGLHGAAPRLWHDLHGTQVFGSPGFLRGASVRWIQPQAGADLQRAALAAAGWSSPVAGGAVENTAALPRARAVPRVLALAADADVRASMADRAFAPESLAFTTEPAAAGDYEDPSRVRIAWREDAPDRVALAVSAPGRAFVVLADAWLPGWSATLDGRPLALHRVDHVFRGVAVPAGDHEVRFAYVPPGWKAGVALAWGGWVAWIAAAAALATARRSGRLRAPS